MEEKENVYLENAQTGTGAEAPSSAGSECAVNNVSTVLGKFKDVDALASAYSSLQAEFTRRSQRLKELEREMEKWDAEKREASIREAKTAAVAEKLRKNAVSAREEGKKFSSFVAELEQVGAQLEGDADLPDGSNRIAEAVKQTQEAEGATSANPRGNLSVARSQEAVALSADELFAQASRNEDVRLKIIGEYLTSLKKSGAPLMTGGVGTLAAPPIKAKTVREAGTMALRFFKNGQQA